MNMSSEKKKHKKQRKLNSEKMCKSDYCVDKHSSNTSVVGTEGEDLPMQSGESLKSPVLSKDSEMLDLSPKSKKHGKKKKQLKEMESVLGSDTIISPVSAFEVKSDDELTAQIKSDNDFFMRVINMIPPQFYFDEDTQENILEMRGSMSELKKGKRTKRSSEESQQDAVKRARFHPDLNQTTRQMADHISRLSQRKDAKAMIRHPAERGATDHLQEVREKLHQKLDELKKQRLGGSMSKGLYMSEKSKLKRRESKLKRKMKLKLEKKHKTAPDPKTNGDLSVKPSKPIFNKEGKLVFSKFDFTDLSDKHKDKPKSEFTGKNYQKLLAKVEKRNEKLKKLKEKNPVEGESMEEKIKWQAALHRAEGVKVKDNPEILKKAMKSKEKMKQARQKKWDERQDRTQKMIDERQQKRQKNIKAQKLKNLDRKVQKLKKKGRLIPGF